MGSGFWLISWFLGLITQQAIYLLSGYVPFSANYCNDIAILIASVMCGLSLGLVFTNNRRKK